MAVLLFALALLLPGVRPAHAGGNATPCVATYGGVLNGNSTRVPNNVGIDGRCTIENYQSNNPRDPDYRGSNNLNGDYTGNITLLSTSDILILDNVDFDGNISCEVGSSHPTIFYLIDSEVDPKPLSCMNNPGNTVAQVNKIDKQIPAGPPYVAIGVPFTYTLTFPQLCAAPTTTNSCPSLANPNGSNAPVSQVTITDNLNAAGVSLSYVSSTATWKGGGAPVSFAVSNAGGLLTFSGFPTVPAGQQIVLKVTVVLNNAVPPNSAGAAFINTANWTLGTTINGQFFPNLPGEPGVSQPLTIAAPTLVMTKGGPATMSIGQQGQFALTVQNTGNIAAWNATIVDKLPTGGTGGMCAAPPQILSAVVSTATGATTLVQNTDYTATYAPAPACTLTIKLLTPAAVIGANQHLTITYQAQLDPNTQGGATLTNVAGATQWFNGPSSDAGRQSVSCPLTNGTPGVTDCQDAHTVTVVASVPPPLAITKTVSVVGGGAAVPGATLDYFVHVVNNATTAQTAVVITDDLNAAGAGALTYVNGSATLTPAGGAITVTNNVITANIGTLAPGASVDLHFQATLASTLAAGTTVTNTGKVTWGNPSQSATASASVTVAAAPPVGITKTVSVMGGGAAVPGATLDYFVHVVNNATTAQTAVVITDDLNAAGTGALTYVANSATLTPAGGTITVTNNVITANIGTLAAGASVDLHFQATLGRTLAAGTTVTNTGKVTWGNPSQSAAASASVTVAPPPPVGITKTVSVVGGGAAVPGATLDYIVHVVNTATTTAQTAVVITDDLNAAGAGALAYVNGSATLTPAGGTLSVTNNVITANVGTLAPGASVDLHFRATLGSALTSGTTVTNTGKVTWGNPSQSATASASVVIGTVPSTLAITKMVSVVGGGAAVPGATLAYVVHVVNNSTSAQSPVVITDDLNAAGAGVLTYVNGSATLTPSSTGVASANGVTVTGNVIAADYSTAYGPLAPGGAVDLHFEATIGGAVAAGTTATNTGKATWGNPSQSATASASITVVAPPPVGITKTVSAVGGGAAVPGATLDYIVHVVNNTTTTQTAVVITDDLNAAGTGVLTYVNGSAALTPAGGTITVTGNVITANIGTLAPGASVNLHFQATLGSTLAAGTTVTNTGKVIWGNPSQSGTASASITVVAPPPVAITKTVSVVGGGAAAPGATLDYIVQVVNNTTTAQTAVVITDDLNAAGTGALTYVVNSATLTPAGGTITVTSNVITANIGTLAPGASVNLHFRATLGSAVTVGTTVTNTGRVTWGNPSQSGTASASITVVVPTPVAITKTVSVVGSGAVVPGATLAYIVHVVNTTTTAQTAVVITDDLSGAGSGALTYVSGSATLAPAGGTLTVTNNVITANIGTLAAGASVDLHFEATLGGTLTPGTTVTNTGNVTWGSPTQTASGSVSVTITPNIPPGALSVTKTTPLVDVTRGQLVPYTITVTSVMGLAIRGAALVDRFPAGFRYIKGSARLDGVPTEPTVAGLTLTWRDLSFASGTHHTIVLLLAVGAGVGDGEFVNRAQAIAGSPGLPISGVATATVRVTPDTTFDCTDVFGKVFDDVNRNGRQDAGERGLAGVHVVTARGLIATTDAFGRFHITCAIVPLEGRGSNFVLKLDERTLPSGYRMSTPAFLVERATRGKALRFNFGASIYRVVGLDLADAVFEPDTTEMRPEWRPRIDLLLGELRKAPSVLHLTYLADVEDPKLVERRLQALERLIEEDWRRLHCCYRLTVESEVFWRYGAPPKRPVAEHARIDR